MNLKPESSKKPQTLPWLIALLAFTTACTPTPTRDEPLPPAIGVDALFKEFYNDLGGEESLGAAISPAFTYGEISYQYTQAALMAYNPRAEGRERFYLAAIGLDTGLMQAAEPPPADANLHYVNGHTIDPSFWRLIQDLGGLSRAGSPITEPRYNPAKKRIEQYFENLGFYRQESEPNAHLLAYGLWRCGESCASPPLWPTEAEVVLPPPVGAEFKMAVSRLGEHFVGFALSQPYTAPDGSVEQIFENVALRIAPGQTGRASLLPLTKMLGMEAAPLLPPNSQPGMFFYPVQENLGYNLPQEFLDYLAQHGGLDASGAPIGEAIQTSEGVLRQCFVNLCLEKHERESGALQIRPAPLGYLLWESRNLNDAPLNEQPSPSEIPPVRVVQGSVTLLAWKRYPLLAPGQPQEVGVTILENNRPVSGVHVELIFPLADQSQRSLSLPPAGEDGQSSLTLEVPEVAAGTMITYTLCAYYPRGQTTCVDDSFLVWR